MRDHPSCISRDAQGLKFVYDVYQSCHPGRTGHAWHVHGYTDRMEEKQPPLLYLHIWKAAEMDLKKI